MQVFPSPWNASNQLVHIGLKGYDLKSAERPRANLVLLVDISGSMGPADRLPLLKNAFRMLVDNLKPEDTVAIVTYANGSDVRLQPTKVAEKAQGPGRDRQPQRGRLDARRGRASRMPTRWPKRTSTRRPSTA